MIVKISDAPIADVTQLLAAVASLKPGVAARFSVERKNQPLELDVTPGVRPKPPANNK